MSFRPKLTAEYDHAPTDRSLSHQSSIADARATESLSGSDIPQELFHRCLVFLFLLGLVIRIGFFIEHAHNPSFGVPTLDQKYYDRVARMLLAGEDLHQLHGFRPLLYPMFLAAVYKAGGSWGIDLALLVQHLLGISTGIVVALLGARLFKHRLSGLAGGLLFLLAPIPLYFEGELLIEPSYTFLICLGLLLHLFAASAFGRKGVLLWIGCGALTVLTAQARPNIIVFLAIYPLFAAWRWWQVRALSAAVPLLGLIGALVMAVPWGFVNLTQSDQFHLLPNAGGVALYLGNKRSADGMVPELERRVLSGERYEDSVEVWAREEYEKSMRTNGHAPETDPMAVSRYWTGRTIEEIRADPAGWLKLMARKCCLTFWNTEVPNNKAFAFLQQEFVWLRWLPVRWVVLLMFAPAGIWLANARGRHEALFILLVYALFYSAANVAFFICDRYRYPVWPVMAIFGGGGLVALVQSIRGRRVVIAGGMLAVACFMTLLSVPNWFGVRLPSFSRDYLFRSIAWYEKGHYLEALPDVDRSVALDASEVTALQHRGNVLFALNRFEEARVAYEQTRKLSPGEAGTWNNLGATLEALGRVDEAIEAFRRATECSPPSQNAFVGMAALQIRAGHFDQAEATIELLEKQPGSSAATGLALRSIIARQQGNIGEASSLEGRARRLNPGVVLWLNNRVSGEGVTQ